MVKALLLNSDVTVRGYLSSSSALISMNVSEGDAASPKFVNIFMGALLERFETIPPNVSVRPIQTYADDVLRIAQSIRGLQDLLDVCDSRASEFGMK